MKERIEIISASAGSGKTTRLARELERAVGELGVAPDRILATTFTKKAAAELVERGRRALLAAGRPAEADLFRAARIGTVNAVAGMIVSDFAFEAGLSPELIVLDQQRAEDAFRRSLGVIVTDDDLDELKRLSARFYELPWQLIVQQIADAARLNLVDESALAAAAEASVEGFVQLLDPPSAPGPTLDARLEAALLKAIAALRERVDGGADTTKKTADALGSYERCAQRLKTQQALPWPDWARLSGEEAAKKSDAACEDVRREASGFLAHPELREDCELAIRLLFDLARRALSAYRLYKAERRAIDFIDQETHALALLRRPDVRGVLAGEIELVLVDEFQDVSPIQLALFIELARIAPRSVWVGDQKQAIYGFRGADPALMEAVVAEILGGVEPETLSVGRRSRAPLVHLTNALFTLPFGEAGLPAARVTLEPSAPDDPRELGPAVERWRLAGKNASEATAALALSVHHFLRDPASRVRDRDDGSARAPRPGDIAVLCRRRDACLAVASALAALDVRASVARVGLLTTPEGRTASAGLRLWVDADDTLARAEIAHLLDPAEASIDALLRRGEPTTDERWRTIEPVARLLAARDASPCAGALDALDSVVEALGLDDLVARWGRAEQGGANLDALRAHAVSFVRLARHRGGASSPAALSAHLGALASNAADTQALVGGSDAVEITTWHASKGLEWPVVVLFEIDSSPSRVALGVHIDDRRGAAPRLEDPLAGRAIRYWPSPFAQRASRTPFHDRLQQHPIAEDVAEAAAREEVRLLYVGWTRARDRLVLAGQRALADGLLGLFTRGGGVDLTEPLAPDAEQAVAVRAVTWGGLSVCVAVRSPPPLDVLPAKRGSLAEIPARGEARIYPPARLRPSDADARGLVERVERIGPAVAVGEGIDPIALGTAVHAFFAADRPGLDADERSELAGRILGAWWLDRALPADELLEMSLRFSRFILQRWPLGRARREWPVEHRLAEGTLVRGTADVVIEADGSLALIDHKVIVADEARVLDEAAGYAGQLRLYADALRAAGPPRPIEAMIHLPLSGLIATVSASSRV